MPLLPPPPSYAPDYVNDQYDNGKRADVARVLAVWRERAADACRTSRVRADIPYGEDAVETFDLFEDPGHGRAQPLLVFIHGGYWRSLSKREFSWIAPPFAPPSAKATQ